MRPINYDAEFGGHKRFPLTPDPSPRKRGEGGKPWVTFFLPSPRLRGEGSGVRGRTTETRTHLSRRSILELRHQFLQIRGDLGQLVRGALGVGGALGRAARRLGDPGDVLGNFIAALGRFGDVAADLAGRGGLLLAPTDEPPGAGFSSRSR